MRNFYIYNTRRTSRTFSMFENIKLKEATIKFPSKKKFEPFYAYIVNHKLQKTLNLDK